MLVNVFSPEQRANYDLEGLWKKGEFLDVGGFVTKEQPDDTPTVDADKSLDDWLS